MFLPLFLAALALQPPGPPAPRGPPARFPQRVTDAPLATRGDYPRASLRAGEQGTARMLITIAPTGRVSSCRVTVSSGYARLDALSCRLVLERARYRPALDAAGRPIEWDTLIGLSWRLPPRG